MVPHLLGSSHLVLKSLPLVTPVQANCNVLVNQLLRGESVLNYTIVVPKESLEDEELGVGAGTAWVQHGRLLCDNE